MKISELIGDTLTEALGKSFMEVMNDYWLRFVPSVHSGVMAGAKKLGKIHDDYFDDDNAGFDLMVNGGKFSVRIELPFPDVSKDKYHVGGWVNTPSGVSHGLSYYVGLWDLTVQNVTKDVLETIKMAVKKK